MFKKSIFPKIGDLESFGSEPTLCMHLIFIYSYVIDIIMMTVRFQTFRYVSGLIYFPGTLFETVFFPSVYDSYTKYIIYILYSLDVVRRDVNIKYCTIYSAYICGGGDEGDY